MTMLRMAGSVVPALQLVNRPSFLLGPKMDVKPVSGDLAAAPASGGPKMQEVALHYMGFFW